LSDNCAVGENLLLYLALSLERSSAKLNNAKVLDLSRTDSCHFQPSLGLSQGRFGRPTSLALVFWLAVPAVTGPISTGSPAAFACPICSQSRTSHHHVFMHVFAGGGSGFAQPAPAVRLLGQSHQSSPRGCLMICPSGCMKASITEGSKFLEHGEFYGFGSQGKFRLKHTNSAKVPLLVIPPVTHSRFPEQSRTNGRKDLQGWLRLLAPTVWSD
jgi:hypothetical protein